MFLWNVSSYKSHKVSHSRRQHSSQSPPWNPQILHALNYTTITSDNAYSISWSCSNLYTIGCHYIDRLLLEYNPVTVIQCTGGDHLLLFSFLGWGETVSTWHVRHYLAYRTSPRWHVIMGLRQSVEWIAGEIKVLGENLSQYHLMIWPGLEPRPLQLEAGH
jgi:hypothetical protein